MKISLHVAYITKNEVSINDTKFINYTFCDLASGNNFQIFSLVPVNAYEKLKQLQVADIDFDFVINKSGAFKLKAIKEV